MPVCLQRRRESSSVLWQMRRQLLLELVAILPHSCSAHLPLEGAIKEESFSEYTGLREEYVVKASALLRLYCALVGIASLRLVVRAAQVCSALPPDTLSGSRCTSASRCPPAPAHAAGGPAGHVVRAVIVVVMMLPE